MARRLPSRCDDASVPIVPDPPTWDVLVPAKAPDLAKSRLGVLGATARERLARAFARDVANAAARCTRVARVCLIGGDRAPSPRDLPRPAGPGWLPDPPPPASAVRGDECGFATLNRAVVWGARQLRRDHSERHLAVLAADLPALRSRELDLLLQAFQEAMTTSYGIRGAFVADECRSGTTMIFAAAGANALPRFGADSAARHRSIGLLELTPFAGPGARCDVDVPADLRRAVALGVGAATALTLPGLSSSLTAGPAPSAAERPGCN